MIKNLFFTFFFLLFTYLFLPNQINAAFRYPVKELDNCRNAKECKLFCDLPKNTPACWSYNKFGPSSRVLGETTVTDEAQAEKNGITFPIPELGNCRDLKSCRQFCREEVNRPVCTDFAVKKKLQKTRVKAISSAVLKIARKELGCDSTTSCHNYCRKEENKLICRSFGEKNELIKKAASPSAVFSPQTWTNAKKELSCSDELSCKNLCNHPDNAKKCRAFAAKYFLSKLAGDKKASMAKELIKSGLCAGEVECAAFCQKNPADCPGFEQESKTDDASKSDEPNIYLGPAGCKTEKECSDYCKSHPDQCPNFPKKSSTSAAGFGDIQK